MLRCLTVVLCATPLLGAGFDKEVEPLVRQSCVGCHNEKVSSGNLNLKGLLDTGVAPSTRDAWERVSIRVRAGEMPPKGIPRPPAGQVDAMLKFLQAEFDRMDRATAIDPGRVTAHRLNRIEYANTIRDLLGVTYRAQEEFPADDSSYGFDNIGAVLTVSPTLMQKYLTAAEQIASRAIGGDPLPKPGIFTTRKRIRRLNPDIVQMNEVVDYDADYLVRALIVGHRGAKDNPVNLVISIDGKPVKTVSVPVQISAVNQQGGATHRVNEEVRVFIPAGEHIFRAEFVDDEGLKDIPAEVRMNTNRNIYPEALEVAGPYAPAEKHQVTRKALLCDPAAGSACVERILSTLSHRAYRRPVTKAEVGQLTGIYAKAQTAGYTPKESLQFAIAAMLVSPNFLFRVERDPKGATPGRITDLELASRLSYFLWSSMPDDELLQLAETNRLHQPAVLDTQVKRLLADARSTAFADNFAGQWLEIRSLDAVKPDPQKFKEWNSDLREAMRTETRMFFEAVLREDRPISDFIDGRYTFLNEQLAKHYGIEGVTGPDFRRVDLTGDQRSGIFTQGSVLTVSSYPTRTSVVLRGKYLLENILNAPPPPPPPDVPLLNEESVGKAASLRQQMEQHRSDALCASCHAKMDVLGFGLENYDAIGRWRTQDGKFSVDSSGAFPNGKSFTGPAGMKEILKDSMPEFTRCVVEKMLTYSLGRGVESFDRRTVQDIVRQTTQQGYRMQALILAIVHSAPFQQRRGEVSAK